MRELKNERKTRVSDETFSGLRVECFLFAVLTSRKANLSQNRLTLLGKVLSRHSTGGGRLHLHSSGE